MTTSSAAGEVIIEDTDAVATRTANEWQETAIWTDVSRITAPGWLRRLRIRTAPPRAQRVDRSAGPTTWAYTRRSTTLSCTPFYRAMLTLFQEPHGQKITIFADAQAASQRITSHAPGPGQRYTLAIAQHGSTEQTRLRATALRD